MHAGLMPNGRVVFLDKVEDYTQIKLDNGQYAYSAEYDPVHRTLVGLSYQVFHYCGFDTSHAADSHLTRPMPSAPAALSCRTVAGYLSVAMLR